MKAEEWFRDARLVIKRLRVVTLVSFAVFVLCVSLGLYFGKPELYDILLVCLLTLTVLASWPRLEVVRTSGHKYITYEGVVSYLTRVSDGTKFEVLSTHPNMIHMSLGALSVVSSCMYLTHKVTGSQSHEVLLVLLTAQLVANPLVGLNRVGTYVTRQHKSDRLTQNNILAFVKMNSVSTTVPNAPRLNLNAPKLNLSALNLSALKLNAPRLNAPRLNAPRLNAPA